MRNKGFTLIELMIVVAIIAIIAAIAIPSLLRSRMAANETASAAACKAYAEAQEIFHRTDWDRDGTLEYSIELGGASANPTATVAPLVLDDLPNLIDRDAADDALVACIDRAFADAEGTVATGTPKAGYVFASIYQRMVGDPPVATPYGTATGLTLGYALSAIPSSYDGTGKNQFMISSTGTIYQLDAELTTAVHMTNFDLLGLPTGSTTTAAWTPAE